MYNAWDNASSIEIQVGKAYPSPLCNIAGVPHIPSSSLPNFPPLRRAAFTTHCPDFNARMQQRQAEHLRDSAEKLNRARQLAADRFRAEWERQRVPSAPSASDPAGHGGNPHQEKLAPRANGEDLGLGCEVKQQRPFLRQQWLQRLQHHRVANEGTSAALGQSPPSSSPTAASFAAADSSSASSSRARAAAAADQESPKNSKPSSRVRKDDVKSVIHLASSDSRANAFVAISSLEGIMSVVRDGGRRTISTLGAAKFDAPYTGSSSRSSRRGLSGAALCVRLGALPAVLGCLDEHTGHKQIEPLAVGLLREFAGDRATEGAIRGNAQVAAVCASRMFPAAAVASAVRADETRAADETGEEGSWWGSAECSAVGQSSGALSQTEISGSQGPLVDTTCDGDSAADAVVGEHHRASDSSLSKPAPFTVSTASPEHAPRAMETSTTTAAVSSISGPPMLSNATPFSAADGATISSAAPGRSGGKSSSVLTGWHEPAPPQLPATDLVFVLSVAVRDSPGCQSLITRRGGVAAMLATLRQQISMQAKRSAHPDGQSKYVGETAAGSGARLAEASLTVLDHLGRSEHGRRRLVREGSVETTIATIEVFRFEPSQQTPASWPTESFQSAQRNDANSLA